MNTHPADSSAPIDKNIIRIRYLAMRERLQPHVQQQAAEAVAAQLVKLMPENAIIAGYSPVRGELDIGVTMSQLAARGHSLCLPVIEGPDKPLFFRRWRIGEPLEKDRFGIDIPIPGSPVFKPDVVLVPMIAFDRAGHRLGYGGGYYDRTLVWLRGLESTVKTKGTLAIGVAYSTQEAGIIPPESHDEKLDAIVTEKEILRFD